MYLYKSQWDYLQHGLQSPMICFSEISEHLSLFTLNFILQTFKWLARFCRSSNRAQVKRSTYRVLEVFPLFYQSPSKLLLSESLSLIGSSEISLWIWLGISNKMFRTVNKTLSHEFKVLAFEQWSSIPNS